MSLQIFVVILGFYFEVEDKFFFFFFKFICICNNFLKQNVT